MLITLSGKLPPGKFPPMKLPPGKFPPRKFPPGIFPPMFLNIPIQVFKFFVFFIIVIVIIDITWKTFVFLTFTFVNICQNLSFELRLPKVSLQSKLSKQCFVIGHFWLFSQKNKPTLGWKFKNDWTKKLQKIPRKINVSLFLAKRKLAEKKWMEFV